MHSGNLPQNLISTVFLISSLRTANQNPRKINGALRLAALQMAGSSVPCSIEASCFNF